MRDTIVMGQSMGDTFFTKEDIRGDVRAFDVRTGELKWIFHTIPQAGEYGTQTWGDGSWEYSGHAPVWSLFAADEELGYVYMPTSSATNDMYGGHRPGDNLFSQSIVCVDVETGERVWHYQLVHHGLWDYDIPGRADPGRPDRRRAGHQGGDPDHQAGVRLCVRPGDRRADLADRGAAGAAVEHAGRGYLPDAAVSRRSRRRSTGRARRSRT